MSTKFEQLLDYLVNEEQDKANELFHEIVVEKSREIYENLIAEEEEEEMDEASEQDEDAMDESAEEADDEEMDESYEEEAVESIMGEEGDDEEFPIQDKTDDAEDDIAADMGDEEGGNEPATKDDIQDLESALDELKAEFEALMAAEKHEEGEEPGIHGEPSPLDDMGSDDESESMMSLEGADDEEMDESAEEDEEDEGMKESRVAKTQGEKMREYIEKVSVSMIDGNGVGSGTGDKAGQTGHDSGKSPISSGSGKPTSGANAKNVAQAGKGANEDGTSPKGKVGGLVKTGGDFVKSGTKNVASSASAKKPDGSKLSSVSKPGNKEGAPVGSGTGDKAGQTGSVDVKSPLNGAPNRAK